MWQKQKHVLGAALTSIICFFYPFVHPFRCPFVSRLGQFVPMSFVLLSIAPYLGIQIGEREGGGEGGGRGVEEMKDGRSGGGQGGLGRRGGLG